MLHMVQSKYVLVLRSNQSINYPRHKKTDILMEKLRCEILNNTEHRQVEQPLVPEDQRVYSLLIYDPQALDKDVGKKLIESLKTNYRWRIGYSFLGTIIDEDIKEKGVCLDYFYHDYEYADICTLPPLSQHVSL